MNSIYNFECIPQIRQKQKMLVCFYALALLVFASVLVMLCVTIENNVILTLILATLTTVFALSSIVFWKVKYKIVKDYYVFLDKIDMGLKSNYIGSFESKKSSLDGEPFEKYVFVSANKRTCFLIRAEIPQIFTAGEKYHLEHVGEYICRWKNV